MSKCDNCGKSMGKKKDGECCEHCGYLKPKLTQLPDATLIYCPLCGSSFLNSCNDILHKDSWKQVKIGEPIAV